MSPTQRADDSMLVTGQLSTFCRMTGTSPTLINAVAHGWLLSHKVAVTIVTTVYECIITIDSGNTVSDRQRSKLADKLN